MSSSVVDIRPNRPIFGVVLIVFSVFLIALQDATIKYASNDLTLWQIYVLRSLISLFFFALIAVFMEQPKRIWLRSLSSWNMRRAILLVLMYVCFYTIIPILPLSAIGAAFYSAPLFITLLSAFLIGEPIKWKGWLGIALGFLGVIIVLQPGTDAFTPWLLLPILAALFYALSAIVTRSRCQQEKPLTLAISLNLAILLMGVLGSCTIALWGPTPAQIASYPFLLDTWSAMGIGDWTLVMLLAMLMVGMGLGLAAAYQVAPPAVVASFDYSYLIFVALFGYLFFAEIPHYSAVLGMVLIVSAGLMVIRQ